MKLFRVLVLAVFVLGTVSAFADNVTWSLNNVSFNDGATATGSFTYNADTNAVSNWNLTTSSTDAFGGSNYNTGNSSEFTQNLGNPVDSFIFYIGLLQLRFTPVTGLTNAGGNISLDLATAGGGSGGVECYNCSPYRVITSGSLSAEGNANNPVPEPSSLMLMGSGLIGLGAGLRRKFGV
ncbi:MAG: putative exosortase interaction protein [Acidobacteriales bacterium]|nr:putative exosortase interaction protein [Terriglobales bacterium]